MEDSFKFADLDNLIIKDKQYYREKRKKILIIIIIILIVIGILIGIFFLFWNY